MIEIQILFILPNELVKVKEYFLIEERKNGYISKFISINDLNLANEIEKSDIQIIVVGTEIGYLTEEILHINNRDNYFIAFGKKLQNNININQISIDKIKSYKKTESIKKSLAKYNEFDFEDKNDLNLKKDIQQYLDSQIPKILLKKEEELRPNLKSTYLESIKIENYFSIKNMEIDDLKDKKEIYFVGENGDGKTVLLQAILLALKGDIYSDLAELYIRKEKETMKLSTIDTIYNSEYKKYKNVENIFAYGINRNKMNNKMSKESYGYSALFDTPSMNRTTYLREPETLLKNDTSIVNDFIERIEDLMGSKLKILRVEDEVKFKEVDGENIDFDMLSEGYKSTIIWLSDLLSRLIENQKDVENLTQFKAIVLVDEIDLYLHPKWRYDFVFKLRKIFPAIQFIMTTHSIVTILGASDNKIDNKTAFYKIYKEKGETKVTNQIDDISSYTANILITSPLFDLSKVTVRGFKDENLGSDDYIYSQIHLAVREHMKNNPSFLDNEIKEKVKVELQERLANLRKE